MTTFDFTPIGTIHSPFSEPAGTPIQAVYAEDVAGHVVVDPPYIEALDDLEGFDYLWLVYVFHNATGWSPHVTPFRDVTARGLFATRAPRRPNPIGFSLVRLISVDGARLEIRGIDVLDGTPLLDIKPFIPNFDLRMDARAGWMDAGRASLETADARFVNTQDKSDPETDAR